MATNQAKYNCGKCGLPFEGRQEICPHCDSLIAYPDSVYTCPSCKKPFKGRKDNCPHCGNKMKYRTVEDIKKEQKEKAETAKRKSKKQLKIMLISFCVLVVGIACWIGIANMLAPTAYDKARSKMIAGKLIKAKYAMEAISKDNSDYDSAQYWMVVIDSLIIVEDSLKKIADEEKAQKKLEGQIAQLKLEIKEIDKFKNDKYRGSIDNLGIELVVFGVWDILIKDGGKKKAGKEANELAKKLEKKVKAIKRKEFPQMRKEYAKQAKKLLWEQDIDVLTWGNSNDKLVFVGGLFAANKNIKDFHTEISSISKTYRFKKVIYKWYDGDDEYTYYTIASKKDDE